MCGIVGYIGTQQAQDFLIEGLQTLEYRGYDSAGIAVINEHHTLKFLKRCGKVSALADALAHHTMSGCIGIGHTRWATHGAPSELNAHPHTDAEGKIAVVHNGIIENHDVLRAELLAQGVQFTSDTDTEVVAHLLAAAYKHSHNLLSSLRHVAARLEGAYALAVIHQESPHEICVARNESPLVVAHVPNLGSFVASDAAPLAPYAQRLLVLQNHTCALLSAHEAPRVYNYDGTEVQPETLELDCAVATVDKDGYPDFMLKEIFEQPKVIQRLLHDYTSDEELIHFKLLNMDKKFAQGIQRIYIVACGTSYHASLVAKQYIESWLHIPAEVEVASEFNQRDVIVNASTLCIVVTQSGETADTLRALKKMKSMGAQVYAITNVIGSNAAREAHGVIYTQAGPEISVASTKNYVAQLMSLCMLSLHIGLLQGVVTREFVKQKIDELQTIPDALSSILAHHEKIEQAARIFKHSPSALFLGRGLDCATAAEGALKLKEISYVHAESYAAGEMKHGPIALLEQDFPVVILVPQNDTRTKSVSNIREALARGAHIIAVACIGDAEIESLAHQVLWIPLVPAWLYPFVTIVPLQLLARSVALLRHANVDQPRNLAKSVTVE